ncbi:PhoH family protein [Ralstonia phage RSP15]|uniref:PhoH-like phosphate starvation-inducible n=1 Tax=Ralstonia phage RSP15 TaxID=1785960 RepID=UPI00074D3918|nr:PhoH-like phosphate starvation-inducible [Ralstonia phage RSP15]BAU40167.1 PhoH family protein [Ralstonia phage RSP15]
MTTKVQRKRANQEKAEQIRTAKVNRVKPKTPKQKLLSDALYKNPLTIATGPAGVGKSYVGASVALNLLSENLIDKIVITRNPLPTGKSLGFFQGSALEKMLVWAGPIVGTMKKILTEHVNEGYFDYLVHSGKIEFVPIEVLKGSSFDRTFLFVEEAQECDEECLNMLSTRMGENSKIFLNGDFKQKNKALRTADFFNFVEKIEKYEDGIDERYEKGEDMDQWETIAIPIIHFEKSDIVRSDLTRKMVEILYT